MLKDAIKIIADFSNSFPAIYQVGIVDENHVIIRYTDGQEWKEKHFEDVEPHEIIKWCELNLTEQM